MWAAGIWSALGFAATAVVTLLLPDVVPWGSTGLFADLCAAAQSLRRPRVSLHHLPRWLQRRVRHADPGSSRWCLALSGKLTTAKLGWLPKPFFSPPQGLLQVYVSDSRLLICIATRCGSGCSASSGVAVGYVAGLALGWSPRFSYWGMPILKLIGPVPASAWIPVTFYFFPTTFHASIFIVALSSGIPVAILTASGVGSVNRAYYDVARTMGAKSWYQITHIAMPGSLPHVFVGLFMGLYYSFAVLVVAEMLGAKYGLRLVHPVPDRLFGLRQCLRDADHHGAALCRYCPSAIRVP